MSLDRSQLAEHLMERLYDALDHNEMLNNRAGDGINLIDFKDTIRQDVLIQLGIIEEELKPFKSSYKRRQEDKK